MIFSHLRQVDYKMFSTQYVDTLRNYVVKNFLRFVWRCRLFSDELAIEGLNHCSFHLLSYQVPSSRRVTIQFPQFTPEHRCVCVCAQSVWRMWMCECVWMCIFVCAPTISLHYLALSQLLMSTLPTYMVRERRWKMTWRTKSGRILFQYLWKPCYCNSQ